MARVPIFGPRMWRKAANGHPSLTVFCGRSYDERERKALAIYRKIDFRAIVAKNNRPNARCVTER